MKIKSLIIQNDDLQGSFKRSILATLIGYGKMYELLHKQLWRKNRVILANVTIPNINDRPVKPILKYNIKDGGKAPYNRDFIYDDNGNIKYYALGLDQLFMGQSPYSEYQGDPKDGIYHDTCEIIPKQTEMSSAKDWFIWHIDGNGDWDRYDIFGNTIVKDVTQPYEKTHTDTDGNVVSDGWFVSITYENDISTTSDDTIVEQQLSDYTDPNTGVTVEAKDLTTEYINLTTTTDSRFTQHSKALDMPDLTPQHGSIIQEYITTPILKPPHYNPLYQYFHKEAQIQSKVIVYADGACIQFTTPAMIEENHGDDNISIIITNGSMTYLPLVYTDTGDLVQNRIDFIDNWDNEFELNVVEDSYWYSGVVKIATVVVSIAIGAYFGLSGIQLFSLAFSEMAAFSGNQFLEIISDVLAIGVLTNEIGTKAIAKEAMKKGLSERTAQQIAIEAGFGETFKAFISHAGFNNLAKIGMSMLGIIDTLSQKEPASAIDVPVEEPYKIKIANVEIDEEDYDRSVLEI